MVGDVLLLGKPLGAGVLSASHRRGQLSAENYADLLSLMTQLNDAGYELAGLSDAHAMTDVTGFGLLGHLFGNMPRLRLCGTGGFCPPARISGSG